MKWTAVVAAFDAVEMFRSRVSVYQHPLAGWPIVGHVLRAIAQTAPPPSSITVLHRAMEPLELPENIDVPIDAEPVEEGEETNALRAAVNVGGMVLLVDGSAPLITPATIARMLRQGGEGIIALGTDGTAPVALCGDGATVAAADDPREPRHRTRVEPTTPDELIRVSDRRALAAAAVSLRDRLVENHQLQGVSFLLPATIWVDADVRIGADTVIYPGVVLEGRTEIAPECVIGPQCRLIDATIGRGAELKGWNYITHTSIRNHAVLEPYVRRGYD